MSLLPIVVHNTQHTTHMLVPPSWEGSIRDQEKSREGGREGGKETEKKECTFGVFGPSKTITISMKPPGDSCNFTRRR